MYNLTSNIRTLFKYGNAVFVAEDFCMFSVGKNVNSKWCLLGRSKYHSALIEIVICQLDTIFGNQETRVP